MKSFIFCLVCFYTLFGCKNAPVIFKNSSKSGVESPKSTSKSYEDNANEVLIASVSEEDVLVANNNQKSVKSEAKTEPLFISKHISEDEVGLCCYVVQKGDTVFSLSKKFKLSPVRLKHLNGFTQDSDLKSGLLIRVKEFKSESDTYHIVKKGETLTKIARTHGFSVAYLKGLNDLDSGNVKVGQKILLTKATVSSSSVKSKSVVNTPKTETKQVNKPFKRTAKFIYPVKGQIISYFGKNKDGINNDGINIKAAFGSSVKASKEGLVIYVGEELNKYGKMVIIKHDQDLLTVYAYLSSFNVSKGDTVNQGDVIGKVGFVGNKSNSQLFFSIRTAKEPVDPVKYLS